MGALVVATRQSAAAKRYAGWAAAKPGLAGAAGSRRTSLAAVGRAVMRKSYGVGPLALFHTTVWTTLVAHGSMSF
jgi:hypothetical protein